MKIFMYIVYTKAVLSVASLYHKQFADGSSFVIFHFGLSPVEISRYLMLDTLLMEQS